MSVMDAKPARIGPDASTSRWASAARWGPWALMGLAMLAAWGALAVATLPAEPMCLMRRYAHLDCPTCGMTRAFALLARGAWRESLALHPWALILALQVAAAWLAWARWLGVGGARPDRWLPRAVALNAAVLIAIWLIRLATGTLPR